MLPAILCTPLNLFPAHLLPFFPLTSLHLTGDAPATHIHPGFAHFTRSKVNYAPARNHRTYSTKNCTCSKLSIAFKPLRARIMAMTRSTVDMTI